MEKYGKNPITVEVTKIDTSSEQDGYAYVVVYEGEKEECGGGTCCFTDNDCSHECATGVCQGNGSCLFDETCTPRSSRSISTDDVSYKPGDTIHVSFTNDSPRSGDWIWIVPADEATVDVFGTITKRYSSGDVWSYACGSQSCDNAASEGEVLLNSASLEPGNYIAYLLWVDAYGVAAKSSAFAIVQDGQTLPPTASPTMQDPIPLEVSATKSAFDNEPIQASFKNPNPTHYDWLAVLPADSSVDENGFVDSSDVAAWVFFCGSKDSDDCDEVFQTEGTVTIDSADVRAGSYRVYLLYGDDYSVLARSDPFDFTPAPHIVDVSLADSFMSPGETIEVSFTNSNPKADDWFAILPADVHVDDVLDWNDVLEWMYACGSKDDGDCEEDQTEGSVAFDSTSLAEGSYIIYFLCCDGYNVIGQSESFVISSGSSPTEAPNTCADCDADDTCIQLSIMTDSKPSETRVRLKDTGTKQWLMKGNYGDYSAPNTLHTEAICVPDSCFLLQVQDKGKNGFGSGGYYSLTVDGETLVDQHSDIGKLEKTNFCTPLAVPSQAPVPSPVAPPVAQPVAPPTPADGTDGCNNCDGTCIELITKTDSQPEQTRLRLKDKTQNEWVQKGNYGDYSAPNTLYTEAICVPDSCFLLMVQDKGKNGFGNGGYYSLVVDGETLVDQHSNIGKLEKTDFCTPLPGTSPSPPVSAPTLPPGGCEDVSTFQFKNKSRDCSWVASKKTNRCKKFSEYCPVTCGTCGR